MKVQISDFFWNKIDDLWNQAPKLSSLTAHPLKQDIYFLIHHSPNTSYFCQNYPLHLFASWLAPLSICVTRHAVSKVISNY